VLIGLTVVIESRIANPEARIANRESSIPIPTRDRLNIIL
jgi:hypothetical protein